MRALRNCDFCGDDAAGTFEIVPPELEPAEDEQRRVVLCDGCERRLDDLLEPLLARAGAGEPGTDDETARDATAPESDSEGEDDTSSRTDDATATEADRNPAEAGGPTTNESATTNGEVANEANGTETGNGSSEANGPDRSPRAYGKVIRLLRNREFPMERAAVESLAAGAYELESHEVEAIVEHAIDRGEFVDEGGTLRRP